jgi:hypothetical protein
VTAPPPPPPAEHDALEALAAAELALPSEPNPAVAAAAALAREIAARHGVDAVAAVLFYGACRRDGDPSDLLDLYVLTTGHRAFHGRALPALLTAALPPTVLLCRSEGARTPPVRAKVAVLSQAQFERRMRPASLDTTLWARFCQPATLVHARDEAARHRVERAVARAVETAALWAVRLGPEQATPAEYWRGLFARTYAAELRTERGNRPERLLAAAPVWYDRALPLALARLGLPTAPADGAKLRPGLPRRRRWARAWALRRACGKALNVLRLAKAAFTFEGGADYLAWKIERHSGVALELADWQRRHPLLAAPALLWRLRRHGAVR